MFLVLYLYVLGGIVMWTRTILCREIKWFDTALYAVLFPAVDLWAILFIWTWKTKQQPSLKKFFWTQGYISLCIMLGLLSTVMIDAYSQYLTAISLMATFLIITVFYAASIKLCRQLRQHLLRMSRKFREPKTSEEIS